MQRDPSIDKVHSEAKGMSSTTRKAIIWLVIALVIVIALTVLAIWFLAINPARTATIRDIVIVLLAVTVMLTNVAIAGVLFVLVFRLQDLIHVLRNEIIPTLNTVSQTVKTVSGTAKLVSDGVARPTIRAAGILAGVQQVARVTRKKVNDRRGV
jgi:methyl-accepting chemotaxis protein